MYYVYALQSLKVTSWVYIGRTGDLKKRIQRHQAGLVLSTKKYKPLRLVYYEAYSSKKDSTKREYDLKHNSQQKEILKKNIGHSLNSE